MQIILKSKAAARCQNQTGFKNSSITHLKKKSMLFGTTSIVLTPSLDTLNSIISRKEMEV